MQALNKATHISYIFNSDIVFSVITVPTCKSLHEERRLARQVAEMEAMERSR